MKSACRMGTKKIFQRGTKSRIEGGNVDWYSFREVFCLAPGGWWTLNWLVFSEDIRRCCHQKLFSVQSELISVIESFSKQQKWRICFPLHQCWIIAWRRACLVSQIDSQNRRNELKCNKLLTKLEFRLSCDQFIMVGCFRLSFQPRSFTLSLGLLKRVQLKIMRIAVDSRIDCFRRKPTLLCRHTNWIIVSWEIPKDPFSCHEMWRRWEIESRSITKSSSFFFLNKHFQFSPISYVMEARKSRERSEKRTMMTSIGVDGREHRWKIEEKAWAENSQMKNLESGETALRERERGRQTVYSYRCRLYF